MPKQINAAGQVFCFRPAIPEHATLGGIVAMYDLAGRDLLILDLYCYVRILADGSVLVWRQSGELSNQRITFDFFNVSSLTRITNVPAAAAEIHRQKLFLGPLPRTEHFEFTPYLTPGAHPLQIPYDWSRFEETPVLGEHAYLLGKPCTAIFAFDWPNRRVEVIPQDWFNKADYDLGYQWIARVARRPDGSIVGDGFQLGIFELDRTSRSIYRWLLPDRFYMLQ
jgi:hypothetical protein